MKGTGGAYGIGKATVELFAQPGALTVFGDLDSKAGDALASRYGPKRVHFLKAGVTKYEDNLALFQLALDEHGDSIMRLALRALLSRAVISILHFR